MECELKLMNLNEGLTTEAAFTELLVSVHCIANDVQRQYYSFLAALHHSSKSFHIATGCNTVPNPSLLLVKSPGMQERLCVK